MKIPPGNDNNNDSNVRRRDGRYRRLSEPTGEDRKTDDSVSDERPMSALAAPMSNLAAPMALEDYERHRQFTGNGNGNPNAFERFFCCVPIVFAIFYILWSVCSSIRPNMRMCHGKILLTKLNERF